QNSELPDQAEKTIEAFSDFILASNYSLFNTIEEFLLTNLPEFS
ncbi:24414_t:CDS:1, partial [Gigaspora margarita]